MRLTDWIMMVLIVILGMTSVGLWIDRDDYKRTLDNSLDIVDLLEERIDTHDCTQPEVPEWVIDDFQHLINNGGFSVQFGLAGHSEDIVVLSGKSVENFHDKLVGDSMGIMDRYYIFMVSGDAFEVVAPPPPTTDDEVCDD